MFLFIYVLTLYNTLVPEDQICGKVAHSGHNLWKRSESLNKVTIFEKHNQQYVKTQQKSSTRTYIVLHVNSNKGMIDDVLVHI